MNQTNLESEIERKLAISLFDKLKECDSAGLFIFFDEEEDFYEMIIAILGLEEESESFMTIFNLFREKYCDLSNLTDSDLIEILSKINGLEKKEEAFYNVIKRLSKGAILSRESHYHGRSYSINLSHYHPDDLDNIENFFPKHNLDFTIFYDHFPERSKKNTNS